MELVMKIRPRHISKYVPRKKRSNKLLQKQQLQDFEHLLDMDLGSFLVLKKEGSQKQAEKARLKLQTDLLKYGSQMREVARSLNEENGVAIVEEFLLKIAKFAQNNVDPALINEYQTAFEKVKRFTGQVAA